MKSGRFRITGFTGTEPNFIRKDHHAWYWEKDTGFELLGALTEGGDSHSENMTPDGKYIVGYADSSLGIEAFLWSKAQGMIGLGRTLKGSSIETIDITSNGNIVVGNSSEGPFIWTKGLGVRPLEQYLKEVFNLSYSALEGQSYKLSKVTSISNDGRIITGVLRRDIAFANPIIVGFAAKLWGESNEKISQTITSRQEGVVSSVVNLNENIIFSLNHERFNNYNVILADISGNEIWRYQTPQKIHEIAVDPLSGNIYFGCADGFFYALSQSGKLLWTFKPSTTLYSKPVISKTGSIYFVSAGFNVYSLTSSGELLWNNDLPYSTWDNAALYYPVVDNEENVYLSSFDGEVIAIDSNGTLRWKLDTTSFNSNNRGHLVSPTLAPDGSLIVGGVYGTLFSISKNGSLNWTLNNIATNIRRSATPDNEGNIYISSNHLTDIGNKNFLTKVSSNGEVLWQRQFEGNNSASPIITPTYIIVRSHRFGFRAYDFNGEFLWYSWTPEFVHQTAVSLMGDKILLGTDDGTVKLLE